MASPTSESAGKYVPAIERKSGWDDYDLDGFLRTLSDAEKIKKNKPLMAALRKTAQKKVAALQAITK